MALCRASGIEALETELPGDSYNLEAYDLAQGCLINTISVLNGYASGGPGLVVKDYNGKFGWYDEKVGASGSTNRVKWDQDKTALMEILPDLEFLSSNLGRGSIEDELIRGLGDLLLDAEKGIGAPLWLAFSAQIYLDVLQPLEETC